MANRMRKTGKIFTTPFANLPIFGISERCLVLCRGLSRMRIIEGSIVTQLATPSSTPLAITRPRSRPRVKLMKHSAMKPATVVMELPITLVSVSWMATAIASLRSSVWVSCSL